MSDQPIRVVVEVATPELIKRLDQENHELRQELNQLRSQHNALHATVYQLLSRFGDLKRSLKDLG